MYSKYKDMKVGDIKDGEKCFDEIKDSVDFQIDCDNFQVGDVIADYNCSKDGFNDFYRIVDVMHEQIILDKHYYDDYLYIRDIRDIKLKIKKWTLIVKNVSDDEWESFDHCMKYESFINDKQNKCICQGTNCQNQSIYSINMNKKTQIHLCERCVMYDGLQYQEIHPLYCECECPEGCCYNYGGYSYYIDSIDLEICSHCYVHGLTKEKAIPKEHALKIFITI